MVDKHWNKALSQMITDTRVVISKRKYYTKYPQTVGVITDAEGRSWELEQILPRYAREEQGIILANEVEIENGIEVITGNTNYILTAAVYWSILSRDGRFEPQPLFEWDDEDIEGILVSRPDEWDYNLIMSEFD